MGMRKKNKILVEVVNMVELSYDLGKWLERLEDKIDTIGAMLEERLPPKQKPKGDIDED